MLREQPACRQALIYVNDGRHVLISSPCGLVVQKKAGQTHKSLMEAEKMPWAGEMGRMTGKVFIAVISKRHLLPWERSSMEPVAGD